MSVQFGRWNLDGQPVDPVYLHEARACIAPYGPDGAGSYSKGNISILYNAFHTTKESRRETQPHITPSGAVITWDGLLDNRVELIGGLRDVLTSGSTDIEIIAAAYEEWGTNSFGKFIGDWALSIWDPHDCSLILAKDHIGTRHLYYSFDNDQVTWSTILDPLVLLAGKTFPLCEEYIAGWLSFFPAIHLTPYSGIHSVLPSCSVLIRAGKQTVTKYWDFEPGKNIRYRTDAEYEAHFRDVFAEAVRHRLRADSPILAELSGGMDSSAIVCMADTIVGRGAAETPRLDTVSYYDDSEPNWNERPYFSKVEEMRGRTGCQIDARSQDNSTFEFPSNRFAATPCTCGRANEAAKQLAGSIISQRNRVVLSGVGGDEVTGGVPTPTPELADLLARAHFRTLAHQLRLWALNKRKPWFHLFFEAARGFFPAGIFGVPDDARPAPWLCGNFVKRNRAAVQGYQTRIKLFGSLPSFQGNLCTLDTVRCQLACDVLPSEPPYEKRYPYLDRRLLEFMYALPREQLVRPGRRRSLMRRALKGIVPTEILERRRKAYISRSPLVALQNARYKIETILVGPASASCGFVDPVQLRRSVDLITSGKETKQWPLLMKTIVLDLWLRTEAGNFIAV